LRAWAGARAPAAADKALTLITAIALWLVGGGGLALYIGWAATAVAGGASPWPYAAGLPLLYLATLVAFALVWFALAWICRARRPPESQIGFAATLRLFREEVRAIGRSGPRMALCHWLMRDPASAPAGAPVLLLHGVLCNAGAMRGLRRDLVARKIGPVYALSYGPPLASIDTFADQVAAKVDAILGATGASRVAIVGHSMGGLVARAYLRRYGPEKVSVVMTLGAPHHGSVHAWLFPGVSLAQLRPGNAWLAELNRSEGTSAGVRLVSLWSWHDSMVAPQTSSRLAGAENIELAGIGHNALLGDRRVYALVAAELMRAATNPATSESPA
jgi:triacylglycerol esterase/lipase EstA (alpha/beta hydrolase family)